MIDTKRLDEILTGYKRNFAGQWWIDERYKWLAIKTFQDNWDLDAPDFAAMLKASLSGTDNLLTSRYHYPREMITEMSQVAPNEVRDAFKALFDEGRDVVERIHAFERSADKIKDTHMSNVGKHYQDDNAASTYLWLRYPDKYYIYKLGIVKTFAEKLNYSYTFKPGQSEDNLRNFYALYDEVNNYIRGDGRLINIFQSCLDGSCYPDPKYRTLTVDIGYYVSQNKVWDAVPTGRPNIWKISEGKKTLVPHRDEFEKRCVVVVDGATRAKGGSKVTQADDFIQNVRPGDFFYLCYGNNIRLLGRFTSSSAASNPELGGSWKERSYELIAESKNPTPYKGTSKWWTPNNNSTCVAVGDEQSLFETLILKPYFNMTVDELINGTYGNPLPAVKKSGTYGKAEFLREVYISGSKYDEMIAVLNRKKNIILHGAPGVGKTYAAERLAYSIMGEKDEDRVKLVQFHQSYSYEDFILGYKPADTGFELKEGIFYKFCRRAEAEPDKPFFFIIDEINRGNMSKIFGELLMMIESDYRDRPVALACGDESLTVPANLYIIGMMNTADRSLAMIDYALRRRFSFVEIEPAFDSDGFKDYMKSLKNKKFESLIDKVKELNKAITADRSLGKGFQIGHSYFCNQTIAGCTKEWMKQVVNYEIIPMLEEYWFDETDKTDAWRKEFKAVLG
ncbi:MAG: AAA family ATPase [Prevotella sp.]|nr:AAA family ATPase [Prevotella sp.]